MLELAKNSAETLFYEAKRYKTYGWSVIPLIGGVNRVDLKRPAIKWGRYQHVHPDEADLENWFLESGFGGLGIVCGRISKLAVLDFDDPQQASEFRRLYPHLADTYTVESGTRHLPHYYYHIPDSLTVHSRSAPGIDFRADGTYVVAPPTGCGEVCWQVVNDVPLHKLSESDLRVIWRFMASSVPDPSRNGVKHPSDAKLSHSVSGSQTILGKGSEPVGSRRNSDTLSVDLLELYRGHLTQGRNNALFQAACSGRDQGLGKNEVIQQLATAHALQPASDGVVESFQSRYAEAVRTITSAFNRPARTTNVSPVVEDEAVGIPTPDDSPSLRGLFNCVREWLLSHALAAAARVLEGLLLAGIEAHAVFTERQACELLQKYRIGRRSIITALKSVLSDGLPLFEKLADPLHTSPAQANAATHSESGLKKCDSVRGANRVKTTGRPAAYYRLPDNEMLLQRLGLSASPVDPVSEADLASPKAYRSALHRELIHRRPGSYSRDWLSNRLGISKWTSRRYEAALDIRVQPVYVEQPVRWLNVESLVPRSADQARPGTFLETEDGKRYPPLRAIALRLLDLGHRLIYKTRVMNYYDMSETEAVGIPTPPSVPSLELAVSKKHPGENAKDSYSHSEILAANKAVLSKPTDKVKNNAPEKAVGIPTPPTSNPSLSFWLCPSCLKPHVALDPPDACARCGAVEWERVPDALWRSPERMKIYWQTRWREKNPAAPRRATPLASPGRRRNSDGSHQGHANADILDADQEWLIRLTHECVPELSRINALHLIVHYGVQAVEKGLARLKSRGGIRNPAGFLISLLKSEQMFYSGRTERSRRPVQDVSEWKQQMVESDYLHFLVNADEFINGCVSK